MVRNKFSFATLLPSPLGAMGARKKQARAGKKTQRVQAGKPASRGEISHARAVAAIRDYLRTTCRQTDHDDQLVAFAKRRQQARKAYQKKVGGLLFLRKTAMGEGGL